MKSALISLTMQTVLALLYTMWQRNGNDGAGNVFIFIVWIYAALAIFLGCFGKPETFRTWPKSHSLIKIKDRLFNLVLVGGTAWAGHTVLATFYLMGWFLLLVRKEVSKEAA